MMTTGATTDHRVAALMPEVEVLAQVVLPAEVSEETGGAAEAEEAMEAVDGEKTIGTIEGPLQIGEWGPRPALWDQWVLWAP